MVSFSRLAGSFIIAMLLAACSKSDGTGNSAAAPDGSADPTAPTAPPAQTTAGNSATVALQGTPPATATVGDQYSFQPAVTTNSTTLSFTSTGLPAWLSLDSNSGVLAGTPSASDEGTTGHITITANAGGSTATSTPFTIRVQAPGPGASGSVKLSWLAPTQNTDGSPVTELAGYRIYYGTDPAELTELINIAGADSTSYVVDGLATGTYYFSVMAYNSSGFNSGRSNIADQSI
jgi:hypothetical protein